MRKLYRIIQVASGNFFEAFDLVVFGTFATAVGAAFFPADNPVTSLMMALMVFAVAYVMRFAGAVILGPYFDHAGRRKGLLISLSLMALGTIIIAFTPKYETIGLAAPLLVLFGRLLQGFSIGAETGGVTAYLKEMSGRNNSALYVCWNAVCFSAATIMALSLGYLINQTLKPDQILSWGFRIPFILGCGVIPLIFYLRRSLIESEEFASSIHHPSIREVWAALAKHWRVALSGMLMSTAGSSMFYVIFTYSPIFAKEVLHMSAADSFLSTVGVTAANIVMLPLFALLSDRIGRKPILIGCGILSFVTAYPAMYMLANNVTFTNLFLVQLWFAVLYASYTSSSLVALAERVPTQIRATGYGVATTLGLAIFGGFTPFVSQYLVNATGLKASPAFWVMFVSACGILGTLTFWKASRAIQMPDAAKTSGIIADAPARSGGAALQESV
ncbi:tricarballylate/proton symporter TcuC [Azospirillum sp. B506]|uniref:tricarballylate/proton symporter TcuC n=1 Tax=Azospirillum sp. B506 TaxID=137721 RepID=UPI00131F25E1|nr:tricarballylate/proton symporter TcuC [Azospirillum sp. B506]